MWIAIVGLPIAVFAAYYARRGPVERNREIKPPEWKGRLPTKRVTAYQRSTFRVTSNYTPRQRMTTAVGLAVVSIFIVLFLKGG